MKVYDVLCQALSFKNVPLSLRAAEMDDTSGAGLTGIEKTKYNLGAQLISSLERQVKWAKGRAELTRLR